MAAFPQAVFTPRRLGSRRGNSGVPVWFFPQVTINESQARNWFTFFAFQSTTIACGPSRDCQAFCTRELAVGEGGQKQVQVRPH
jgi:hypothetical protein